MSSTILEETTAEDVDQSATVTVIVERAPGNWCAYTPDEIGVVVATGPTRDAVIESFRSALRSHLQAMRDQGLSIPDVRRLQIQEMVPA